ncbi:hypothetical protein Micbo1qcDRAFT_168344 [Microdochium bolleyi]|uniref:Uncharacterized protein n=1 Tax=Microdochium bolleyi TaxID=196109 RepID=A0A136INP5_9PEZI|nr:hypothetical protein Micbo1qcDRAFT_168344 [Microdochium bolleyi]
MASSPPQHRDSFRPRPRSGTTGTSGTAGSGSGGGILDDIVRRASVVMNSNPQLGMWQAAGTAIAQAPNLSELRSTETGGSEFIEFNSQGHSTRRVAEDPEDGELVLVRSNSVRRGSVGGGGGGDRMGGQQPALVRRGTGTMLADVDEEAGGRQDRVSSSSRPVSLSGAPAPDDSIHGSEDKQQQQQQQHRHRHGHRFRGLKRRQTLKEKHKHERLESWGPTVRNGLLAFWKFFTTFAGFCITIYCLNIVAWGAMLFFLLLNAAPAMAVPTADDDNSPRKIWLEIDSQILNALFCVTGFGLAPWRFRDLYFFIKATRFHDVDAMQRLARQNNGWFRPPRWAVPDNDGDGGAATTTTAAASATSGAHDGVGGSGSPGTKYSNVPDADHDQDIELGHNHDDGSTADFEPRPFVRSTTFTGQTAPPTALWKLFFTIMMMIANTGFQCALCYFMWGFNRFDRPTWATGTFIALGCGTGMASGLMSWWEGRKVKKIEGPEVQIVEKEQI